MNLHKHVDDFKNLISIVSDWKGISETYIERDYFIVYTLLKLQKSIFSDRCVFKGGTSLSKCYSGSIERFSEDIDLTYLSIKGQTDSQIEKDLKKIELILSKEAKCEVIDSERNKRNKSSYINYNEEESGRIKLEIGSSVKPDPFELMSLKSYIHEYLLEKQKFDSISEFSLREVYVNTLRIERTFLDKVFAIKRHSYCGSIQYKVRHIYDVVMLFGREEIQKFIGDYKQLKRLVQTTKRTDCFYFEKRKNHLPYNPMSPFNFSDWNHYMDDTTKKRYESLHEDLLFTNIKQDFESAIQVLEKINSIFKEINE